MAVPPTNRSHTIHSLFVAPLCEGHYCVTLLDYRALISHASRQLMQNHGIIPQPGPARQNRHFVTFKLRHTYMNPTQTTKIMNM